MSLRPRSDEILASILASFEEVIVPELQDAYAVSMGHTIVNLLRHLCLRVQLEGPALYVGNRELRSVLSDVRAVAAHAASPEVTALVQTVSDALVSTTRDPDDYPSVADLTEDAVVLGTCLDHCIRVLQQAARSSGADEEQTRVRRRIRDCLADQLTRESTWVEPAFRGTRR